MPVVGLGQNSTGWLDWMGLHRVPGVEVGQRDWWLAGGSRTLGGGRRSGRGAAKRSVHVPRGVPGSGYSWPGVYLKPRASVIHRCLHE